MRKRHLIAALARNLGVLMRALFGMGTPRGLQKEGGDDDALAALRRLARLVTQPLWAALLLFRTLVLNLRRHADNYIGNALAA